MTVVEDRIFVDEGHRINVKKIEFGLQKRGVSLPGDIRKRDGGLTRFDLTRVGRAVQSCFNSCDVPTDHSIEDVATRVANLIASEFGNQTPSVENVQDAVQKVLFMLGEFEAATRFIVFRERRSQERKARPIPDEVRTAFEADKQYFPTQLQQFQYYDKYSRYNYLLGRRETWVETVDRSVDFLRELSHDKLDDSVYDRIHEAILTMRVMPSMRLLAMAGPAARRNNLAIFNCSYLPVCDAEAFVEALLISMAGCGVGYSVETQYVEQFPRVKRQRKNVEIPVHVVQDSTEGWAEALRVGLAAWFDGRDVTFDFSLVREAGVPLLTKGGRASGPEPLKTMLTFVRGKILARQGSFIHSLDANDIMCAVGNAAVSGGVRRTAMISLFDINDSEMASCKNGENLYGNEQRWNANNSAVWPEDISTVQVMEQWAEMVRGSRGEPGIFSRHNAVKSKAKRRKKADFGTNPCGEINLRPYGLCNLSAAIARPDDTIDTLLEKVELAAIIGCIQSMATHYPGLREDWKRNAEEERLLGVDVTGQMDCPAVQDAVVMEALKARVIDTASAFSELLGIPMPAATTCVKPSGNSSQFVNCSSGLHRRHAPYYIRNIRVATHSPLFRVLKDVGAPMHPENGQTALDATTWVIHFPVKSPEGSVVKEPGTAIAQCEYWLMNKIHFTEHNPSVTISYDEPEVIDLVKWVWDHREIVGGMSFLPNDNVQYDQAPYEAISEEEYERLASEFPVIDFSKIFRYESEDMTTAAQELACMSGSCEL